MKIRRDRTAALIIDIQERLFPVMTGKEDFLLNCTRLIKGLRILEIPLLVTQQYSKGLGETIPGIATLIPDFSFIEKRDFSCCGEPELLNRLKELECETVLLCGIEAHVCVLQSALDLQEAGLHPVIVMDAVTSRFPVNLDLARERFRQEGILMTSVESVLFELTGSSASPEFREISRLVK